MLKLVSQFIVKPKITILVMCRKIPANGSSDDGNVEKFGDYGGRTRVQRGWLAEEMLIQFKLCPGGVTLYKR